MKLMKSAVMYAVSGALSIAAMGAAQAADITGAGATFPAPVYAKWADAYQKATGNKINYQAIGSGGGIKQINAKTVDFGASDMPLSEADLNKAGLIQFPTVIGGVVPVVQIPGITPGQLELTGELLADIYMGKIKKWNDPAIAALNPKLKLPDLSIQVIRRADASGTSFIFTHYLSEVSSNWKNTLGEGTSVNWPVGTGGKGNEGVAAFVQRLKGSIGYVEYAYAKQNKMSYIVIKNKAGSVVAPSEEAFKAAAASADWSKSYAQILTNQAGKNAWPISGATFILLHKSQEKPTQGVEVMKFFDWAYKNGSKMSSDLDYVPLPENVQNQIRATWKANVKDASGKALYN